MKLSVYVPKDLEASLEQRAKEKGMTPALFIQHLIRERLEEAPRRFSSEFEALAGSWEDERTVEKIVDDLESRRRNADRPASI